MRDEREKRDRREIVRTRHARRACRTLRSRLASPATLAFLASPALHAPPAHPARRASPASRACHAPCGHSSALSPTDPHRTHHTKFQLRAEAPRLIQAGQASVLFLVALPTVPTVLHTLPHVRDQLSTPDQTAIDSLCQVRKQDKRETIHASFHQ